MILNILYYLLFSGTFYLLYRLLFARLSFHRLNRILLLALPLTALAIALIAPQFSLNLSPENLPVWQLPEIQIEGQRINLQEAAQSQLPPAWSLVYVIGIGLSLIYFASGLFQLWRLLKTSEVQNKESYKLYWSSAISSAFCFGPYIFLPFSFKDREDLHLVLEHEIRHQKMGHVWDRLYYKVLNTLLWFDPFLHALAKELRQVHEYEVDADLVQNQNIEDYAHTLLRSTLGADLKFPEKALAPSPFFNSSLIKSRITMMYSNQSQPWRKALYALVLPLAISMSLFACNKTDDASAAVVTKVEEKSLDLAEVDELPIAGNCNEESTAEDRKACVFQSISEHIINNFSYPELAKSEGLEGNIYVAFVIEKNGSISEVEVVRSLSTSSEAEETAREQAETQAKSLVASIPSFTAPAKKGREAVRLKMIIPIQLKLK
ncbi:M56 family metallopeptidase [Croceimicrobium sp.]|uniref:M56 family metallopeptidase n=1 Tax=Croceimicrobium sp. TaxID=2828340 RepID=UPI003BAC2C88